MQRRTRYSAPTLGDAMAALSNARRRQIVRLIWDRERSAGEIASAFDVSWPAISQNLRLLKSSGLVTERRQGTHRLYKVDRKALGPLATVLKEMWQRDLSRLKQAAEREARGEAGRRRHIHD